MPVSQGWPWLQSNHDPNGRLVHCSRRSRYPPTPFVEFAFACGARVAAPHRLLPRGGHPHPPHHSSAVRTSHAAKIDAPPVLDDRPVDYQHQSDGKPNEKCNSDVRFSAHWWTPLVRVSEKRAQKRVVAKVLVPLSQLMVTLRSRNRGIAG